VHAGLGGGRAIEHPGEARPAIFQFELSPDAAPGIFGRPLPVTRTRCESKIVGADIVSERFVLDGDRLVGRIDAALDTRTNLLAARSVNLEPGVRTSAARTARVRRRFEDLARFVGADGIDDVTASLT